MYWLDEVNIRLKRKNQVLFAKDSAYLQDVAELLRNEEHRVLVLWALDLAAESVSMLESIYPKETRPREALESAREWAAGSIKMRIAQRKILDCHALAKELTCKADIAACHAVGQACSVVHTVGHAIGYPIYDLTSVVYRLGADACTKTVERRKQEYIDKLFYWQEHLCDYKGEWAGFMLK